MVDQIVQHLGAGFNTDVLPDSGSSSKQLDKNTQQTGTLNNTADWTVGGLQMESDISENSGCFGSRLSQPVFPGNQNHAISSALYKGEKENLASENSSSIEDEISDVGNAALTENYQSKTDDRDANAIELDLGMVKKETDNLDDQNDLDAFFGDSDDDFDAKPDAREHIEKTNDEELNYDADTDVENDYSHVLKGAKDTSPECRADIEDNEEERGGNTLKLRPSKKVVGGKKRKQTSPKKVMKIEDLSEVNNISESGPSKKVDEKTKNKRTPRRKQTEDESSVEPLYCEQCNKTFSTFSAVKKHRNWHAGIFMCSLCNKSFSCQSSLDTHMDNHEGRKLSTAICNVCDKRFYDTSSLNKHIKTVHMDFRPNPCPYCDKKFSEKKTLAEHVRVHTGERPFACEVSQL